MGFDYEAIIAVGVDEETFRTHIKPNLTPKQEEEFTSDNEINTSSHSYCLYNSAWAKGVFGHKIFMVELGHCIDVSTLDREMINKAKEDFKNTFDFEPKLLMTCFGW